MAVIPTNPIRLAGPWTAGYVLDYHSVSATPTGDPYHPFEMKYTELGARLYRFKYRGDATALPDILDTVETFVRSLNVRFECIATVPPSKLRATQPVVQLASELAKRLGVPVSEAIAKVKQTESMKNIAPWERARVLEEALTSGEQAVKDKSVLLLDDLIDSGSTLRRATDVLFRDGGAAAVYALALTRTR
jgi:competence protein ComFC